MPYWCDEHKNGKFVRFSNRNITLLKNVSDHFARSDFRNASKVLLTVDITVIPPVFVEPLIWLTTHLTKLGYFPAKRFNNINAYHIKNDFYWKVRLLLAVRSGDTTCASVVIKRHKGDPFLHMNAFLSASWEGNYREAAEHAAMYSKHLTEQPGFPFVGLNRIPPTEPMANGVLDLTEGFGEKLMCLNIISENRDLSDATHTVITPSRHHKLVQHFLPNAHLITPDRVSEGSMATFSSDLIFSRLGKERFFRPLKKYRGYKKKKLIGVAWRGGVTDPNLPAETSRTTSLENFISDLPEGDFTYVSLQPNLTENETQILCAQTRIKKLSFDLMNDHVRLLHVCAQMRGIISVEGSNLHIAGQVGIPALALMPKESQFSDAWQWYLNGVFTPPYANFTSCSREHRSLSISSWLNSI